MGGGFDWGHMFGSMGLLAWGVVITLAIMSLYSLTMAVERWWTFSKMRKATLDFLPVVANALKDKDLKGALEATRRHKRSHLAKVLAGGLHEFINHEDQKHEFDLIQAVERALERAAALTSADMRRGLGVMATVASTAPFVGLLGTVGGIINAFQGMALTGSGGLGAVSAGIAEALITTAFGLFVAIPAVWFFNYFTGRIEYYQVEMTNSASELLDFFMKRLGKTAPHPASIPARH
jgi:biopolymer transport protein ExbB/biopolymer transport protein TolQ